jgi:TRAP-type mannitol/chloroaromatic compound transport system permease small subunit
MRALLRFSSGIDRLNVVLGKIAAWCGLIAVVVSSGAAIARYALNIGSNAWLELQWYLFAGMVMLGASYTLKLNEHVRVDVLYSRYGDRARLWLDLVGGLIFLLPMTIIIGWFAWPMVANSYGISETSSSPGGLLRWPVKVLVPLGFLLLSLQGVSEIIKRAAALAGYVKLEAKYERPLQ